MELNNWVEAVIPEIEIGMQEVAKEISGIHYSGLHAMLNYHMVWDDKDAVSSSAQGKRIRPLMVALVCSATGGDWRKSIPAAAAVELLHNFSLIHDDIEDNSPTRRNRLTLWKQWGIPQAINTGDALLTLAHLSLLYLSRSVSHEITLVAAKLLQETCLKLTQGQYLDISFETRSDVSLDEYWAMIQGKTAVLLSTCAGLGALVAGADYNIFSKYRTFGEELGLAFQVRDDILGIWGNAGLTGKSIESDLATGKKTLPVIFGLEKGNEFAQLWRKKPRTPEDIPALTNFLELEGGLAFAEEHANRLTKNALQALFQAKPQGKAGEALYELANQLLSREK